MAKVKAAEAVVEKEEVIESAPEVIETPVVEEEVIETPVAEEVKAAVKDTTVEDLQKLVADLKAKNEALEATNAELLEQSKQIKEIEKIVEVPIEKIVEKIVYAEASGEGIVYKYAVGDKVFVPTAYQRLNFEVRAHQGFGSGQPLYRLFNHKNLIEMEHVREDAIELHTGL